MHDVLGGIHLLELDAYAEGTIVANTNIDAAAVQQAEVNVGPVRGLDRTMVWVVGVD